MRTWWEERAERRRYASDRAGISGRAFARERMQAFVRPRWRQTIAATLALLALGPVLWFGLTPISDIRGFALGAYVATALVWMYHWIVLASGAASITMGHEAEVWTNQELGRLDRRWRVLNHVTFRFGDIDHIAIGPDGVIVIETKWTSAKVTLDGTDQWLAGGFKQAKKNASDVEKVLGWGARSELLVSPLLVVWGPQVEPTASDPYRDTHGVNVIAGTDLRKELSELGDVEQLDESERDRIYEVIRRHVDKRDKSDAEKNGPVRASLAQIISDWMLRLMVGLAGWLVSSFALRLGFVGFLVCQVASLVAGLIAVRSENLRRFAWSWIVGTQLITLLVAIDVIVQLAK